MVPVLRERLRPMVELRMDPRLRRRLDVSDVLQDALAEVSEKLDEYENYRGMPFFVWVRMMTGWKLDALHRQHLGVKARDAGREVSWRERTGPGISGRSLSEVVSAGVPSPLQEALDRERVERLADAMEGMELLEREVLALRHFEELSNGEVAHLLDLTRSTASRAYGRALRALHRLLDDQDHHRSEGSD